MEAKIQRNASCEDIRIALSGFGRFSSIEIDKGKDTDGKENGLIFREVGFFKEFYQKRDWKRNFAHVLILP
jgi:hypothetical protein